MILLSAFALSSGTLFKSGHTRTPLEEPSMTFLALLLLGCLAPLVWGQSAHRPLSQDFTVYEEYFRRSIPAQKLATTPLGRAKYFTSEEDVTAIKWSSRSEMELRFWRYRDERPVKMNSGPFTDRRASWLYPHDGCWIRAILFNRSAYKDVVPVPNTIYAFGNLRVRTNNATRGVVGWWYHVAPIIQLGEERYVLDPAIEPRRPLALREWLGRMGAPGKIKIAVCASGTSSPRGSCTRQHNGSESWALSSQRKYLNLEWNNLINLKRNPYAELGDQPPW